MNLSSTALTQIEEASLTKFITSEDARIVGGVFSLLAILISLNHYRRHLVYNNVPLLRKQILRVLGMVPLYAVMSFFGLILPKYVVYWDITRDFYESAVIYCFVQFLITFLGGPDRLNETLANQPQQHHLWPIRYCLQPWRMHHSFLYQTRLGVLQYVVIKLCMAICTFAVELYYHDYANNELKYPALKIAMYTIISIMNNCSQLYALYCLVLFYQATEPLLKAIRPMAKFLVIKSVVFFTFWQYVFIEIVIALDGITATANAKESDIAASLQDFLVCIEMFIASMAHMYAFPVSEFSHGEDSEDAQSGIGSKLYSVLSAPADFAADFTELRKISKRYAHAIHDSTSAYEDGMNGDGDDSDQLIRGELTNELNGLDHVELIMQLPYPSPAQAARSATSSSSKLGRSVTAAAAALASLAMSSSSPSANVRNVSMSRASSDQSVDEEEMRDIEHQLASHGVGLDFTLEDSENYDGDGGL